VSLLDTDVFIVDCVDLWLGSGDIVSAVEAR
jgi:hypothetical protein